MKKLIPKRVLVTHQQNISTSDYLEFIKICISTCEIDAVQLRDKQRNPTELLSFASQLHELLKAHHIPLIINDHLDLCLTLNAEGLHLGQDDGDIKQARDALGSEKILGLSINSLSELEHANHLPLDYVGIGAIFPTPNKPDIKTIWGLNGLTKAAAISKHPIIAIGGIHQHNIKDVLQAGAIGIAAIDYFHGA